MAIEIGLYEIDDYYIDREDTKIKLEAVADLLNRARELIAVVLATRAKTCDENNCSKCKPYHDWIKDFDNLTINKKGE